MLANRKFKGRRRFMRDHYAPGGTRTDPLNIEIEIASESERAIIEARNSKRRKIDIDGPEASESTKISTLSPQKHKREHNSPKREKKLNKDEKEAKEIRQKKKEYFQDKYRYGNFDRYYGIRLSPGEQDKRLTILKKEWFEKKSVLDIGCNVGYLTISIAKNFMPRRILGIDIDEHLIGVARKNIRHYCDHQTSVAGKFPVSFGTELGPISKIKRAAEPRSLQTKFPDNVWFRKENYVLDADEMLEMVEEEFDVILALSITKWIHLNWGDDGMRRFLLRAYKHLLPGGRLIIEPQVFETYRKRAKQHPELKTNYTKIEFKPEDFEMYLIETVGFESVEHLGVPSGNKAKGFDRCIDVYVKPLKSEKK